jgi:hypothetical protein
MRLTTPIDLFIATCIVYDMIQTTRIFCRWVVKDNGPEATGLVLLTSALLSNNKEDYLKKSLLKIAGNHWRGEYRHTAKQLLSILPGDNPILVTSVQEGEDIPVESSFAMVPFLRVVNNSLFEEYVNVLNQFAEALAQADNIISREDEEAIKNVYRLTHRRLEVQRDDDK